LGHSVSGAGDINGDGFADILVGKNACHGDVQVYFGGALALSMAPSILPDKKYVSDQSFGSSVASVGDVNGDGFADIVVRAATNQNAYGTLLYLGGPAGLGADFAAIIGGIVQGVKTVGDVNGDGFADVVSTDYTSQTCSARVSFGGPAGISGSLSAQIISTCM
jgi:hypothetical protein